MVVNELMLKPEALSEIDNTSFAFILGTNHLNEVTIKIWPIILISSPKILSKLEQPFMPFIRQVHLQANLQQ